MCACLAYIYIIYIKIINLHQMYKLCYGFFRMLKYIFYI